MIEEEVSYGLSVPIYQTTRCQIPGDNTIHLF